ncbi:fused MFS/spermidine synthase [Aquabacterium sp.]|uniref:fused MFS/spermidine synthase n=1 Tax=Aquabacterium sp. TaxID=1872578 RepID=UPI003784C017
MSTSSVTSNPGDVAANATRTLRVAAADLFRYAPNDRLLALSLLATAVASLAGLTGAISTPWNKYGAETFFLVAAMIGALWFVVFAYSRPGRAGWLAATALLGLGAAIQRQLVSEDLATATAQTIYIAGPFAFAGTFGALSVLVRYWRSHAARGPRDPDTVRLAAAMGAILFVALFTTFGDVILGLTTVLHPATLDPLALAIDRRFGFDASAILGGTLSLTPAMLTAVKTAYMVVVFGFPMLFGLQLRTPRPQVWNFVWTWAVLTLGGMTAYHLFPIAGPRYWLGPEFFAPTSVPAEPGAMMTIVPPAPRNGMPSLHFGWAFGMWLMSYWIGRRWVTWLFGLFAALMILATLGLGEHYLIDLAVAVPFVGAIVCLTMHDVPWQDASRRPLVLGGFGLYAAWILAMRFASPLLLATPGLLWLMTTMSLVYGVMLFRRLETLRSRIQSREVAWGYPAGAVAVVPPARTLLMPAPTAPMAQILFLFIASGFAGLMYEVVFSKQLALVFGSTAQASYTVLATYMGGMAIGSWLGGRLYRRYPHGLALYLLFEAGVGAYCVAAPWLLEAIQAAYIAIASGTSPEAGWLVALRFGLGSTLLIVPTILMGASLPVLVAFLRDRGVAAERPIAMLYAANTIGAALGAFTAGYLLIPTLGLRRSIALAAAMSLLVAWFALRLLKADALRLQLPVHLGRLLAAVRTAVPAAAAQRSNSVRSASAMAVLAVAGVVTMIVETNHIHLLATVAGSSTYAFSLMLSTFLLGLAAGAYLIGRWRNAFVDPAQAATWILSLLALTLILGGFQWGAMADYFGSYQGYRLPPAFGPHEFVRGIVCFAVMFPPAVLIGALYPVAMHWAAPDGDARNVGIAAAVNTFGNIAGVFIGGFVLLPLIGAHAAAKVAALFCAVLALGLSLRPTVRPLRLARAGMVLAVGAAGLLTPWQLDMTRVANGANVYFAPLRYGSVIDFAESVDGGLSAVARSTSTHTRPILTLTTNGKFQGNDSPDGEMQAQLGFSVTPLLHTAARDQALVIGYGTGMSAHVLREAGFKSLDIADLSADIVRLADKHFASINGRASQAPGVHLHITDGRNLLLLSDKRYDLIGIEVTSIWFSGAGSLYNKDFYELVKRRLQPDGVLQQWVQLHHMRTEDLLTVIGSVRAVFPEVWIYVVGKQGIILAGNSPRSGPTRQKVDALAQSQPLADLMRSLKVNVADIEASRLLNPRDVDRILLSYGVGLEYWVSTDDNLRLEYGTPRGNVLDGDSSYAANLRILRGDGVRPKQ